MRWLQLAIALSLTAVSTTAKLCFPSGFLFGSATASYQVEGAWNEGGRTPSIWDDWCRSHPKVECANVADDFYHRYKDDIAMIKHAGHKTFRFSISWSRAMNWDNSTRHMKPNPVGIAFYHALIDELTRNDITPILTIYHWDLPSELETQLEPAGWLAPQIQDHYVEFATLLFHEFGSKVTYWATFNEPMVFTAFGYGATHLGGPSMAPGHSGSDTFQYTVAHHVLLSHAKAVNVFRDLKTKQVVRSNARIGIVIPGDHTMPADPNDAADIAAAERVQQFSMGWWLNPIVNGDYPAVMRERIGDRLPRFTEEETKLVHGSYDLFMLNHYNTHMATDCSSPRSTVACDELALGMEKDLGVDHSIKPHGARNSGIEDGIQLCSYFSAYPQGYRELIKWTHHLNTSADILLTENGFCGNSAIENEDQLWYHQTYLEQVHKAVTEDKIPVIGYTAWSLMDNYEWGSFKPRFGLYFVNYTSQVGSKESWTPKPSDLARVPRLAATWFSEVTKTGCMEPWQGSDEDQVKIVPSSVASAADATTYWISGIVVVIVLGIAIVATVLRRRRAGSAQERASLLH